MCHLLSTCVEPWMHWNVELELKAANCNLSVVCLYQHRLPYVLGCFWQVCLSPTLIDLTCHSPRLVLASPARLMDKTWFPFWRSFGNIAGMIALIVETLWERFSSCEDWPTSVHGEPSSCYQEGARIRCILSLLVEQSELSCWTWELRTIKITLLSRLSTDWGDYVPGVMNYYSLMSDRWKEKPRSLSSLCFITVMQTWKDLITLCSGPFWHFVPMFKGVSRAESW